MQTKQVQLMGLLAASALVMSFVANQISCHQVPPSEPYSYHFDPYSYGYETEDNYGNKQWKQERSSHPQEVHGSYGYRDKNGVYREVVYVADKNGFRANIKTNEPGVIGADKAPASTKIDSYYSPPSSPAAPQHYSTPTSQYQQPAGSPPVYIRQPYALAPSYYQNKA